MNHRDALAALDRHIRRAQRALIAERWLVAALPALAAILVWLGLAMSGATGLLGPWAQSALHLAGFAVGLWLMVRAWRRRRRTTRDDARARLAQAAGFEPGAFETLDDQPARLDPTAMALWRAAQDRAAARVETLRRPALRLPLQAHDPRRLRYVALIVLVAGAAIGGAQAPARLADALYPDPGPFLGDRPIAVEAWLTPAEYTGASPVSLSDRLGARIAAPPSVTATVRATGPRGAPILVFDGEGGRRAVRFARAADGAYEAELALPGAGRLRVVRYGRDKAAWRIVPARDAAPEAGFRATPTVQPGQRLIVSWSAADDFGLRGAALRVRPLPPERGRLPQGLRGAPAIDTPLALAQGDPRRAAGRQALELAAHPYAGLRVEARIVAFDALGQAGESAPFTLTLPEKTFLQPLARAAIEVRQTILWERRAYRGAYRAGARAVRTPGADGAIPPEEYLLANATQDRRIARAPAGMRRAIDLIDIITMMPEDGYFRDRAVYAGFLYARAALKAARDSGETARAADILWRTALRAEYGGAVDARDALELAQEEMARALAAQDSQERLAQVSEALRIATERYLQALVAEAMRNGDVAQTQEDTVEQTELTEHDIERLMDAVDRAAQEGRTEDAERMLEELDQLLANLDVRLEQSREAAADPNAEAPPQEGEDATASDETQQAAREAAEALDETLDAQRAVRDETQAQQGEGENEAAGGSGGTEMAGQGLAQSQADVRSQLDAARSLAQEAGAEDSSQLSEAESAMRRAEDALQRGDFAEAGRAQNEALSRLREGADALARTLEQRENAQGENRDGRGEGRSAARDPLGRLNGGLPNDDGGTRVPTAAERGQSQILVEEIRRRAQDASRSEAERAYLRRLLERFDAE
ncbi:MAG: DUF4175 family protein [Hyphomonadaceae bacterium]|nr:DUF4175 family protein [Hyphomonadaceae bacterium]